MASEIFISHRTTNKDVADMLIDFFSSTGIPATSFFCSSLPGNDVKEKIAEEVKQALSDSSLNFVILSSEYYQSAYCLNEAGVLWFLDTFVVVIALPEIEPNDMIGFLDSNYRVRRLNSDDDIAAIYDQVVEALGIKSASMAFLTRETAKLKRRYTAYINQLPLVEMVEKAKLDDITTDDERVILYYLQSHKLRRVNKSILSNWLTEEELYNINIENAFDLLANSGRAQLNDDTIELDINFFRDLTVDEDDHLSLQLVVSRHRQLSCEVFQKMWHESKFNDNEKLFIFYIIDESVSSFGDRWMADGQMQHIKNWEHKWNLMEVLSDAYGKCLGKFKECNFVFESSWTSHGNPREYSLHKSLKSFLFNEQFPWAAELESNKKKYQYIFEFSELDEIEPL